MQSDLGLPSGESALPSDTVASDAPLPTAPAARRAVLGAEAIATSRLISWNRLRILACIDVVSFHLNLHHAIAGIGLPTSLVVAYALGTKRPKQAALSDFVKVRFRRLIMPWAFWTLVFGVLLVLSALKHGESPFARFEPIMLLYGTAEGLWFLPTMALGGIVAYQIDRATRSIPIAAYAGACVCAALLLLFLRHLQLAPDRPFPFIQWRFALIGLPVGLLVGRLLSLDIGRTRWLMVSGVACAAVLAMVVTGVAIPWGPPYPALRYALVVALLALGVAFPGRPDPITSRIEPLLLGMYLLHFLIYDRLILRVAERLPFQPSAALLTVSTLVVTALVVAALRKTPLRKVL